MSITQYCVMDIIFSTLTNIVNVVFYISTYIINYMIIYYILSYVNNYNAFTKSILPFNNISVISFLVQ
jgi:hypothetical protein